MGTRDRLAFGVLPSDRRYRLRRARFLVMADVIARRARRVDRPLRVLDAGIGRAKLTRFVRVHHPDASVRWTGLDLLRFRLRSTRDVPGIREVQGDVAGTLPFVDGAFDAVVSSYVLQHLDHPTAAVREMARVLRPGGLLLLGVPGTPQPLKLLLETLHPAWTAFRRWWRDKRYSYRPRIQFYDLPRVRRIVRAAGLRPRRWQGLGFVTGGPLAFLENRMRWFWWNLIWGRRLPHLASDLVCLAERPGGPRRGGDR